MTDKYALLRGEPDYSLLKEEPRKADYGKLRPQNTKPETEREKAFATLLQWVAYRRQYGLPVADFLFGEGEAMQQIQWGDHNGKHGAWVSERLLYQDLRSAMNWAYRESLRWAWFCRDNLILGEKKDLRIALKNGRGLVLHRKSERALFFDQKDYPMLISEREG